MVELDGEVRRFKRMYICLAACKTGWINGCRPVIGLDGCHIKGNHHGQILTAVGIDANNGMFPIAYAVVEVESTETWRWLMEYLKEDLFLWDGSEYCFISDKQKGLLKAVAEIVPGAEHRHCVRHFYNNFKCKHAGEGLKQSIWNAARSTNKEHYKKNMEDLKRQSEEAYNWFEDKPPHNWSRSHFRTTSKCDILLNNICESFNASILKAKDKPILTMLDAIRMNLMIRMANRRVAVTRWRDFIGSRIKNIIDKTGQNMTHYQAHMAREFAFQVTGGVNNSKCPVDLGTHSCTCGKWQVSGIPCVHAICAIYAKYQEPALYVDNMLLSSKYEASYHPIIFPITGEEAWEPEDFAIAPPVHKRQAGRPKMKRIPCAAERMPPPAPDSTKLSKALYGMQMTCSKCKHKGHNKRGCPPKTAPVEGESNSNGAHAPKRRVGHKAKRAPAPKPSVDTIVKVITSKESYKKRMRQEVASSKAATCF